LHDDQRAAIMDILSENSKKEYPKSVTKLLRLARKIYVYFVYKNPKFILKN
jgi:hypothetical protein